MHFLCFRLTSPNERMRDSIWLFSFFPFLFFFPSENKRTSEMQVEVCQAKWRLIPSSVPLYTVYSTDWLKNTFNYVVVVKFHLAERAVEVLDFGKSIMRFLFTLIIASMHYLCHVVSIPGRKDPVVQHFQDKIRNHFCIEISCNHCESDRQKETALRRGSSSTVSKRQVPLAKLLKTCQNSWSKR